MLSAHIKHAHSRIKFKSLCSCSLCDSPAPIPTAGGVTTTGIASVVVKKPYEHQPIRDTIMTCSGHLEPHNSVTLKYYFKLWILPWLRY